MLERFHDLWPQAILRMTVMSVRMDHAVNGRLNHVGKQLFFVRFGLQDFYFLQSGMLIRLDIARDMTHGFQYYWDTVTNNVEFSL